MGRPLGDPETIYALAEACGDEHRALVLMLYCSGLTWSEATALTRKRCDPEGSWVEVVDVATETAGGVTFKPQKLGYAAMCTIEAPASEALAKHLAAMGNQSRQALVFTDTRGAPLRRSWFYTQVWLAALIEVGVAEDVSIDELAVERLRGAWADKRACAKPRRVAGRTSPGCSVESEPALSGWREWDSVIYLLSTPCLKSQTARFVNASSRSIDWEGLWLAAEPWSDAELLLIGLAENLWHNEAKVSVRGLVDSLDDANFVRAIRAIEIARGVTPAIGRAWRSL